MHTDEEKREGERQERRGVKRQTYTKLFLSTYLFVLDHVCLGGEYPARGFGGLRLEA